jgi:hypothetical protein
VVVAFGAGAGILVAPQAWWLFAVAIVLMAIINWPERRRRTIVLSPDLGDSGQHYHYCPACDQQWHHDIARCVAHWAGPCPACTGTAAPPARSA